MMRPSLAEMTLIGRARARGQSKKHSALEIGLNYATGFVIAWAAWHWGAVPGIAWLASRGVEEPLMGLFVVSFFTVISVIRSYFWRRIFNAF